MNRKTEKTMTTAVVKVFVLGSAENHGSGKRMRTFGSASFPSFVVSWPYVSSGEPHNYQYGPAKGVV